MGTMTALRAVRGLAVGVGLLLAPLAMAAGRAPTPKECAAHPTNPAVKGGCIVINRALGNCMACHVIAGTTMDGNVGPALRDLSRRFPNKQALFEQIYDPTINDPYTAMPPFGKDHILTKAQIREVVDFLWTL
ncbi:sulfur oxidation c-type cytochrome SoxX [Acidiferrobacter sp.]|uniref:sulfur oxidation c-type cytochrome SoxX n=1 Tax=Acidiferrobacter sp. TaxID=1872107 RepID=UPI0026205EE3|nr:sulfur oxidation c-type cytochrome SoxX [Acidiferrobacter sp.]